MPSGDYLQKCKHFFPLMLLFSISSTLVQPTDVEVITENKQTAISEIKLLFLAGFF